MKVPPQYQPSKPQSETQTKGIKLQIILYTSRVQTKPLPLQVFDFPVMPGAIWDSSAVPCKIMETGVRRAAHKAPSPCQSPTRKMHYLMYTVVLGSTTEQMEPGYLGDIHSSNQRAALVPAGFHLCWQSRKYRCCCSSQRVHSAHPASSLLLKSREVRFCIKATSTYASVYPLLDVLIR